MIPIHYPMPQFRTREDASGRFIFDEWRRTWLKLTPEEWVRQNFVKYLIRECNYPSSYVAMERRIRLGELIKRFDILVYDRQFRPWMMIECKSMDVKLDAAVLEQILRYNISVPVPYLVITNGHACYGFSRASGKLEEIDALPSFS